MKGEFRKRIYTPRLFLRHLLGVTRDMLDAGARQARRRVSRLKGAPAPGSNPLGELLLFLLFAPFTLPLLRAMQGK